MYLLVGAFVVSLDYVVTELIMQATRAARKFQSRERLVSLTQRRPFPRQHECFHDQSRAIQTRQR